MANSNHIVTDGFSSPATRQLYESQWPDEPHLRQQYKLGGQCGACSCYAEFNSDWGLCCCPVSRHYLETVFEHFTCPALVYEGWNAHSFCSTPADLLETQRMRDEER